jgi:hypothetical protein
VADTITTRVLDSLVNAGLVTIEQLTSVRQAAEEYEFYKKRFLWLRLGPCCCCCPWWLSSSPEGSVEPTI